MDTITTPTATIAPLTTYHFRKTPFFVLFAMSSIPPVISIASFIADPSLWPALLTGAAASAFFIYLIRVKPKEVSIYENGISIRYIGRSVFLPWADVESMGWNYAKEAKANALTSVWLLRGKNKVALPLSPSWEGKKAIQHLIDLITEQVENYRVSASEQKTNKMGEP